MIKTRCKKLFFFQNNFSGHRINFNIKYYDLDIFKILIC